MGRARTTYAFTLVELAVVLVIIALISGMGLSAGIDGAESTRAPSTEKKMDVIENSLLAFRKKYGRLPCPGNATLAATDASYGLEAATGDLELNVNCSGGTPAVTYMTVGAPANVPSGSVPVRTLGLPDEMMYDGWGRKFHYEVTPALTEYNGFSFSQVSDNCQITAKDNSDTALTLSPAYALLSYGKNGIGGYLKSGAQYTSGTAGTAEATNIRTSTNTPTVRMKSGVTGAMGSAGYYDDIVRVKSRYQLMDANDRNIPVYTGPDIVISQNATTVTQLVYGKKICGRLEPFSGTVPAIVAAAPKFLGFTPSNTNLFVYHTNSCKLYSIIDTVLAAVTEATPVPNCPAAATVGAMAQTNGMLALNSTTAPFVRMYKLFGTAAAAKYMELPNALDPALLESPTSLSMSENGEYLAVARRTASTSACTAAAGTWRVSGGTCTPVSQNPIIASNLTNECGTTSAFTCNDGNTSAEISATDWAISGNISDDRQTITWSSGVIWERRPTASLYIKKGDHYQTVAPFTGDTYAEYSNAISPSGKYYATAVLSGSNTRIYIWRNINGTFLQLTTGGSPILHTITGMTAPSILTFSPDSKYLAIGGSSAGDNIAVLYINPVTEVVSSVFSRTLTPDPAAIAFSKDSNMMAVARATPDISALVLYTRTEANGFVERTTSSSFTFNGSANGNFVAFSR